MIIDIPPHIEQAMIAKAEQQGLSVIEMLAKDYANDDDIWLMLDKYGLNADNVNLTLNERQARQIMDLLDNPPPPNPIMQEILALGESMMKGEKVNV